MSKEPRNEGAEAGLTVFYDGSCPLCTAEIGAYRRCKGADSIAFVDVASLSDPLVAPGLSKVDAMKRFHIRTASGAVVSGGRAFAILWAALPTFSLLGRLFQTFPFSVIIEGAYRVFLRLRPTLQKLVARRAA